MCHDAGPGGAPAAGPWRPVATVRWGRATSLDARSAFKRTRGRMTPPPTNRLRTLIAYAAMIAATVGLYFFIRARGEELALRPSGPEWVGATATAAATAAHG